MKNKLVMIICLSMVFMACKEDDTETPTTVEDVVTFTPVEHASLVLQWNEKTIYVDPTLGEDLYTSFPKPDIVLITDIHGDHLSEETIAALDLSSATIIAPQAVVDKFTQISADSATIMANGETKKILDIGIEAIPMYNLRDEALAFHTKGRGNGYVLTLGEKRVYISGDTEDIPEMRALENIDMAFVCMNLPYTMPVESAVSAVLEFKPKEVYPYHYRGIDDVGETVYSDVNSFKAMVNAGDATIKVILNDAAWYPNKTAAKKSDHKH